LFTPRCAHCVAQTQAIVIERIEMQCRLGWMLVLAATAMGVQAQSPSLPAPPSGVLNLTTTATTEVTKDVLTVVFSVTREGSEAQSLQTGLKQALDAALAEARKIARPGQVEVQTGNFSLYPRYVSPAKGSQPVISGWQGTAELSVQGKDVAAIAQLTGRIQTMTIARVGYSLSREAREKFEADVVAQAIARWRAKAMQMSQQFGYTGYSVREVSIATSEPPSPPTPMLMKAARASAMADEALPTEAGKGDVTATVSGSAQMTR
jgi:predicted secreted protein